MYNGYFLFILVVAFGAVYTFCTPAIKVCEDQQLRYVKTSNKGMWKPAIKVCEDQQLRYVKTSN